METVKLGSLRVRRVVAPGEKPVKTGTSAPLTVVLLHGFGAPGDDLVGLASPMQAPPGTTFLFPEAPRALSELVAMPFLGDARAWWMIDVGRYERAIAKGELRDLTREIPAGLAEARAALTSMLDALERAGTPSARVVLGGFSQGSMLATDFALRDPRPLAGLVVLSGTLLAEDEWLPRMKSRGGLPVLQSHGTSDPILPFAIAERLHHALEEAGLEVSFTSFDGGHGIPPQVIRDLGTWLMAIG